MAAKVIAGYVEMPQVRPKGRSQQASDKKSAAADRLESLMTGGVRAGVENDDTLKEGYLTPGHRVAMLMARIKGYDARRAYVEAELPNAHTVEKVRRLNDVLTTLDRLIARAIEEVQSIQVDLVNQEE